MARPVFRNGAVTMATAGTPCCSIRMASSTLLDEQDPQSPTPEITRSASRLRAAIAFASISWLGERLTSRMVTRVPCRAASRSATFSRIAAALILRLSTSPRRRPCRLAGRGASWSVAGPVRRDVGSKIFIASSSSDARGDRARPLLAPAGQHRGPAPRAARADDQQVVRRLEAVAPRRLVLRHELARQPRGALEVRDAPPAVLDEERLHVAPAPAARPHDVRVLEAHHHQALVEAVDVRRAEVVERIGIAEEDGLRRRRELVVDLAEAVGRVERQRALVRAEAAAHVERLPGRVLPLREAER